MMKIRAVMARIFSYFGRCTGISLKFYGQRDDFCWFVRKQNAFYGQTAIFKWFVRKFLAIMMGIYGQSWFLEHLSVKPGPKRLNFYGQTAVFDHFVRNRHFSRRPITDKVSIFIDLSVNGGKRQWFCQMQCCASSAQSLHLTSVTGKTLISYICP